MIFERINRVLDQSWTNLGTNLFHPVGSSQTVLPKNFESFPWPEPLPMLSIEPLLEEAERKPTMKDWV